MSTTSQLAASDLIAPFVPAVDAPIGVFDSGVGGLTVLRAIRDLLPREDLLYLGDTARVPYGNKAPETVRRYALGAARFLVDRGVKALVIACNTASAFGLRDVAAAHSIPVIGVIDPVAELAARRTLTATIGVIGTRGTVQSEAYPQTLNALRDDLRVIQEPCPLFVPLAEEGWSDDDVTTLIAERYLAAFAHTDVDTLILGCTHYPLLRHTIDVAVQRIMSRPVELLDTATATAAALQRVLVAAEALSARAQGRIHYCVTDDPGRFTQVGQRFMGEDVVDVEHVDLVT